MAESSSSLFDRTLANIGKCDGFSNFRESEPKMPAIGLHKPKLLPMLDGKRRPTGAANAEAAADWTEYSNQLFSILFLICLLYTSPSPRDQRGSRMPSSA